MQKGSRFECLFYLALQKISILKEIHSLLGNAEHPNPGSPFCWRPPGNEFEKRLLSSPISEVKGYMYACFNMIHY